MEELKNAEAEQQTAETTEAKAPEIDYKSEFERLKAENEKLRGSINNASADAAGWKRKYRDTLGEAEKAAAERAEADAEKDRRLKEYEKKERISGYKVRLMDAGYDTATASEMAEFLPEGIGDEFFNKHKAFMATARQQIVAESLKAQPTLSAGAAPSKEALDKQREAELAKYFGL